jgi:hypothetical protein
VQQHVGKVKTEASKKPIPLDEDLIAELLAWRRASYAGASDFVFASDSITANVYDSAVSDEKRRAHSGVMRLVTRTATRTGAEDGRMASA